jgi:ribosomal-protein-alanine N-acetyltransferase
MAGVEIVTRTLAEDDVPELVTLLLANRAFLEPWDPIRADDYYSPAGQLDFLRDALAGHTTVPRVIVVDGRLAGRITVSNIVRGAFESCTIGYWVAQEHNGKGVATAAVADTVRFVFDDLRLHRVEAGTLVRNIGSQRVLERNGFIRYGLAPRYLRIAGRWQDHVLYQKLNPARENTVVE